MVFKKNITVTISCYFTEMLISFFPAINIIVWAVSNDYSFDILFYGLISLLIVEAFLNLIFLAITLISRFFIKTRYTVGDMFLIVETKNETREIDYKKISAIVYDLGRCSRYLSINDPSELVLFDENYKDIISISCPPLLMVHMIKKHCPHAKVSYYNKKRFLITFIITNAAALLIAVIAKLVG